MPKLCIDPGHGGRDRSNRGPTGYIEADGVLEMALIVRDELRGRGVDVVMTRETDQDLADAAYDQHADLQGRCDVANNAGADYFVSIHTNAAGHPAAQGTETFCYAGGGPGENLARAIQSELVGTLGTRDRGVKTESFYVLRNTAMPAALTEVAFHSNPDEEAKLKDPDFRRRAALAIARGIISFLGIPVAAGPDGTPIMGRPEATAHQLGQLLRKRNSNAPNYARDYLDIGVKYGVRGDLAFCQSIHETGAWRFGGQVLPEQNNFAGLGATNGGPRGASFATPQLGIEAQIQHLYLYATTETLPTGVTMVDPRWDAAVGKWGQGAAPNVEDLAGKWAVPGYDQRLYNSYADAFAAEATYGQAILRLLKEALTYPAAPEQPAQSVEPAQPEEELLNRLAAADNRAIEAEKRAAGAEAELNALKARIAQVVRELSAL